MLGKFIEELDKRGIPWSIENPTNSLLWCLYFFLFAIVHGEWVDCHACAFGGARKKLTTFLVSDAVLFKSLNRFCPGDHEHEEWGYDHATSTFNAAKEAEYPDDMCRTYANIVLDIAQRRGLFVNDFNAKSVATGPQQQKRGRRVPQLIAEFLWTKTVLVQHVPAVDHKKMLIKPFLDFPAGCKLLRTEANKGNEGNLTLCVFGCYRSQQQFVDVARQLWHPYDELKNLPDAMIKCLFWYLSSAPADITKYRVEGIHKLQKLNAALTTLETNLHQQMNRDVARVLQGKNVLLMRQTAEDMKWPDMKLFDEMTDGFTFTGILVLVAFSNLRPAILGRLKLTASDELLSELVQVTEKEKSQGWLEGPFDTDGVTKMLGAEWLPVRRFGVKQKAKVRPIDDFRENNLNQTFGSVERPELRTMDHVLWSLVVLAQHLTFHERMVFRLSDGSVLEGEVHSEWKRLKPSFKVTCVDLQSAYKQLATHPSEQKRTVVTLWDKDSGKPMCYVSRVLPFGASASVHHFLRVSSFLHAAGLHVGLCWATYFDDFAVLTHECHEKSALNTALSLFEIFGFRYSQDKLLPFDKKTELLGVELDLTNVDSGFIKVRNKQSRVDETVGFLEKILDDGAFLASEMPSKLGKLQYAEAQLWGRCGRLALADIRELANSGMGRMQLDHSTCRAIGLLKDKLKTGKPKTLRISRKERPVLVFTDGSLEYENGEPVASIGGVCIEPNGAVQVFGASVPMELLNIWMEDGEKEHAIGLVELYAVLVALHTWQVELQQNRLLIFVDNWPVVDALVKGVSGQSTWRDLLMTYEMLDERIQPLAWVARVPSSSNPADPPSRGTLVGLEFLMPFNVCQCKCPVMQRELQQIVNGELKQKGEVQM
eukprot:s357_g10.t1